MGMMVRTYHVGKDVIKAASHNTQKVTPELNRATRVFYLVALCYELERGTQ